MNKCYNGIVIISDMDHTMLDSRDEVSDINRAAILEFINGGGLFGIATGRTILGVLQFGEMLPMNIPGIVFNGAVIYDFKSSKELSCCNLNIQTRHSVKYIMERFPDVGVELHSTNGLYITRQTAETDKHLKRELIKPIYENIENVPDGWYKVILTRDPEIIKEIELYANEWLNENGKIFRAVYTEPQFLEFLPNDISKGAALLKLIEILNVECKNVISIGDNMNDIEMIQAAGIGIAVSNALDPVKNIADIIGCSNKEHIIRWTLDNILC